MNKLILLATIFFTATAGAYESEVVCNFPANNQNIKSISINTGEPGSVNINYTNIGFSETLKPVEGRGGLFKQLKFQPVIKNINDGELTQYFNLEKGYVFDSIVFSYRCNNLYHIFCDTRGGDSDVARVMFNIDGQVYKFLGNRTQPLCKRTVIRN